MKIGLIVIDDGLYTHLWVDKLLQSAKHTVCVGACLSPFKARSFSPRNGFIKTIHSRGRFYGLNATIKLGGKYLLSRKVDLLFRYCGLGTFHSVRTLLYRKAIPIVSNSKQDINDSRFHGALKEYNPDVLVCAFSQKAEKSLLNLAHFGCLNIHFSCLPENGGREPVFWSLLGGIGYGVTVYRMCERMDAGEVFAQKRLETDNIYTLDGAIRKVCKYIPEVLLSALENLEAGRSILISPNKLNTWPTSKNIKYFKRLGYRFV